MFRAPARFPSPLRRPGRPSPRSVILSLALISLSAVALNLYLERTKERHAAKLLAAQHEAAERQRRNDALMDAYGDRSNLGKLEQAVHFYEKKR